MAITVDNYNWEPSEVSKLSKDAFIALHMADEGTYERHTPERKKAALELVYDQSVPVTIKPVKKAAITPSLAEGEE